MACNEGLRSAANGLRTKRHCCRHDSPMEVCRGLPAVLSRKKGLLGHLSAALLVALASCCCAELLTSAPALRVSAGNMMFLQFGYASCAPSRSAKSDCRTAVDTVLDAALFHSWLTNRADRRSSKLMC